MSKAIKTLAVAFAAAAFAAPLAQADASKAPRDAFKPSDALRLHDVQRLRDVQRLHDAYRLHGLPWDGLRLVY